jgi:methylglutaconyl-CoA hydratase
MANSLDIRRDAGRTELRLNRPAKANALSSALVELLLETVLHARTDGTRLLVLRGEGANFCAGFDFSEVDGSSDGDLLQRFVRIELLLQAVYHAPYVTMALCHGGTYGAGADIVCACDHRIAVPNAVFRMPGLRFGIALGTRRLVQRIGPDAARDILGSSRTFNAAEAERLGFLSAVEDADRWERVMLDAARAIRLDTGALATLKSLAQPDTRSADLAAIAQSASVPGLKDRIKAFRAAKE